jgi:hypothetical protein
MRVFDLVGVMEAVEEIRGELEGQGEKGRVQKQDEEGKADVRETERDEAGSISTNDNSGVEDDRNVKKKAEELPRVVENEDIKLKERVVPDSQEEEDEMLFELEEPDMVLDLLNPSQLDGPEESSSNLQSAAESTVSSKKHTHSRPHPISDQEAPTSTTTPKLKYSFILVSNLASLINPLLSQDYKQSRLPL